MNTNLRLFFTLFAALATQFSYADSGDKDSKKPNQERRDSRDDRRDSRSEQRQVERKDSRDSREQQRPSRDLQSQPSVQRRPDTGPRDNRDQQRPSRDLQSQPSVQRRPDAGSRENREQQRPSRDLQSQPSVQRRPDASSREYRDQQRPSRDQHTLPSRQPLDQRRPDVGSRESLDLQNERNYQKSMENYGRKFRNEKSRPAYNLDEVKKRSEEVRSNFDKRREFGKRTSDTAELRLKRYHPGYRNWFNPVFFQRHNYYPKYWRGNANWWSGAQWNQVNYWLGWGNTVYPIYYDVGGYPIPIDRNWQEYGATVSAQDFSQLRGEEWLPLGVFALGQDAENAVNSDVFIQLAVDRRGNLSGTYYNAATDKSYLLEGDIDPTTQQAYWRISQQNFVLEMETGVYNLTQDFAYVQLTFLGGIVQNWVLVRVID